MCVYICVYKNMRYIRNIRDMCLWWSSPNSTCFLQREVVSGLVLQVSSSVVVTALPGFFFHFVNFSVYCSSFIHMGI